MEITIHEADSKKIAEVAAEGVVIGSVQDALDLMVNPRLEGAKKVIVRKENLAPEFFDLRTGLAGEILQKFVNYQVQLAIVGDFQNIASESLKAFIIESNRGKHIFFLNDSEAAKNVLSGI